MSKRKYKPIVFSGCPWLDTQYDSFFNGDDYNPYIFLIDFNQTSNTLKSIHSAWAVDETKLPYRVPVGASWVDLS